MLRYLHLFAIALLLHMSSNAQNPKVLSASASLVYPYDSVSYTHSNGRETIIKSEPYYGTSVDIGYNFSQKWAFSHSIGNSRFYKLARTEKCTYNSSNSLTSYYIDNYDTANNSVISYQYLDYTYNTNQTIDSVLYLSYNPLSAPKPWKTGEKYIYDNAAQLIRKHILRWDSTLSVWVDQGATDSFTYNSNGKLVKAANIDGFTTYTYDNNGLKIADTTFWGWATYTDLWVYDYYPAGNLKSKEHLQYDMSQQIWLPYEKTTYNYNGNNCTDITYWSWDKTNNTYQQNGKIDYLYNNYNQIVQAGDTRYYYEGFPAGVAETAAGQPVISISPIPAVTYTNLEMDFDSPTAFSVIIFDMQGRIVKQFTDKASGKYKKHINVQDIPAGQYMLQVKTGSEARVKNFTVIR